MFATSLPHSDGTALKAVFGALVKLSCAMSDLLEENSFD